MDLNEVLQEILKGKRSARSVARQCRKGAYSGKALHVLRPCSRKHERLTIGPNLADDFTDLGFETHIKHTVSLIQNEVGDTAKVRLLRFQHINEATRSSDHNLDTTLEITDLWSLWRTAIDGSIADT